MPVLSPAPCHSAGAIAVTSSSHGDGGVAFMAHVAGFVVGIVGVYLLKRPERVDEWWV